MSEMTHMQKRKTARRFQISDGRSAWFFLDFVPCNRHPAAERVSVTTLAHRRALSIKTITNKKAGQLLLAAGEINFFVFFQILELVRRASRRRGLVFGQGGCGGAIVHAGNG